MGRVCAGTRNDGMRGFAEGWMDALIKTREKYFCGWCVVDM